MDASPDFPRQNRVPVFNLPTVVTATILTLIAIHAIRSVLPDLWDATILFDLSFIPARWTAALDPSRVQDIVQAAGAGSEGDLATAQKEFAGAIASNATLMPWTFATYALLHASWGHVLINMVWLAAFGTPVVRAFGPWRYGAVALVGILAGAVLHLAIYPLSAMPVIGASAGISAMMGAATRFVFQPRPAHLALMPWQRPPPPRVQSLSEIAQNRTALLFVLGWLATNLIFGLLAVPLGLGAAAIAWDAHIGGFLAGFLVMPFLEPHARN